jgi:hypothetical protein
MHFAMENSFDTARETFDPDDKPKFGVVVIYQDGITGRRGKLFYDKLVHELGTECDFSLDIWNFEVLAVPEIGDLAARAAAQAALVILSFHGRAELPPEIRGWIQRWPKLITYNDPALVALLDEPKTKRAASSTLAYLRSVADRNGVDFFMHTTFSARGHRSVSVAN